MPTVDPARARWTFLTNHAHVLVAIANNPDGTTRQIAEIVGITERAVQRIVAELEEASYLSHHKEGRRNRYRVHPRKRLRHPMDEGHNVGELIALLSDEDTSPPAH